MLNEVIYGIDIVSQIECCGEYVMWITDRSENAYTGSSFLICKTCGKRTISAYSTVPGQTLQMLIRDWDNLIWE